MQFWRPGDPNRPDIHLNPGPSPHLTHDNPIIHNKLQLLYALEKKKTIILQVYASASKSTELPRLLADQGWTFPGRCIAVALPRKFSVLTAALRLANDSGLDESHIGADPVGYVLPHNTKRSFSTKVVYFTYHSLLSTIFSDPLLTSVSVVILDDANERTLITDLLIALLRRIQILRSDLRIVIISTTLDMNQIRNFFGYNQTALVILPYYQHQVTIMHSSQPVEHYINEALNVVKDCHEHWLRMGRPTESNILIFVAGADEAEHLCELINDWYLQDIHGGLSERRYSSQAVLSSHSQHRLLAYPLYASMPHRKQASALSANSTKSQLKVVVATNMAELSVSVEGIATVIDCGYEKLNIYNTRSKTSSLAVVPISKMTARQRARCVGRISAGVCIRLYTASFLRLHMSDYSPPELLRCELTQLVITLKAFGIENVDKFEFMNQPPRELFVDAFERLYALEAIDKGGNLTPNVGFRMSNTMVGTHLVKCIITAERFGVGRPVAAIVAMLEVRHVVYNTSRNWEKSRAVFGVAEGDLLTLLNVWSRYVDSSYSDSWCREHGINIGAMRRAKHSFFQISRTILLPENKTTKVKVAKNTIGLTMTESICRSIAGGLFENAAMVQPDGSYLIARNGNRVHIHSSSIIRHRMPKWVVFLDLIHGGKTSQMRDVTVIKPLWLVDTVPQVFKLLNAGDHG